MKFNLILFCPLQHCSGPLPIIGVWTIMNFADGFLLAFRYLSLRESLIKSIVTYLSSSSLKEVLSVTAPLIIRFEEFSEVMGAASHLSVTTFFLYRLFSRSFLKS